MSYFAIKIFAIITMVIDHVGLVLMNNDSTYRLIGRISFPLFCFLLVNGYHHTTGKIKYLWRMIIFAIISEIIYDFTFFGSWNVYSQNIFFTLAIGLIAIMITEKYKEFIENRITKALQGLMLLLGGMFVLCCSMCANELLQADYGWYGILMIYFLYLTYGADVKNRFMMCMSIVFVNFLKIVLANGVFQAYSILSISFIMLFREKEVSLPKPVKLLGYVFYPAHLLILFIIKRFI